MPLPMNFTKKEPSYGATNTFCSLATAIKSAKNLIIKRVATRVVKLKMKCKIILNQQYMNEIVNLSRTGEK